MSYFKLKNTIIRANINDRTAVIPFVAQVTQVCFRRDSDGTPE